MSESFLLLRSFAWAASGTRAAAEFVHQMNSFIWCVFGKRGSGKTCEVKRRLIALLPEPVNIVIYDPLDEYREPFRTRGFQTARAYAEFRAIVNKSFAENRAYLRVIFSPNGADNASGDPVPEFERVAGQVKRWKRVIFLVEEADQFCNATRITPSLAWMINYGRHEEQSLIALSRRHSTLNRNLTAQASLITTFKQSEPRDIAVLEELGFDGDAVRNLKNWKFLEKTL